MTARALLLTGTVGVGKTSVAAAVGDLLRERQVANAVVDLDELRRAWPAAPGDRFNTTVMLANLSAVAANYVGAGFTTLVSPGSSRRRRTADSTQRRWGSRSPCAGWSPTTTPYG